MKERTYLTVLLLLFLPVLTLSQACTCDFDAAVDTAPFNCTAKLATCPNCTSCNIFCSNTSTCQASIFLIIYSNFRIILTTKRTF